MLGRVSFEVSLHFLTKNGRRGEGRSCFFLYRSDLSLFFHGFSGKNSEAEPVPQKDLQPFHL